MTGRLGSEIQRLKTLIRNDKATRDADFVVGKTIDGTVRH